MDFFSQLKLADRCQALQQVSYLNLAISLFILVGILFSYLPQHHRIISRRTPEGISAGFILLGATSSTSALGNILLLPGSRADVACCKTVSGFECLAGLLGIAQIGVQWSCFAFIFFLYLIFTPRGSTLPTTTTTTEDKAAWYTLAGLEARLNTPWQKAIAVATCVLLHAIAVVIVSAVLYFFYPQHLGRWSNILGITSACLAIVQYIPQIRETWIRGSVGSFSIPMMLIQTPGSFVWAASLAARFGVDGWSSWGVLFVTGCLQGTLLVMCVMFEYRDQKAKKSADGEVTNTNGHVHNARCVVGYLSSQNSNHETDDEGGAVVENEPSERSPLIKKQSRIPGQEN